MHHVLAFLAQQFSAVTLLAQDFQSARSVVLLIMLGFTHEARMPLVIRAYLALFGSMQRRALQPIHLRTSRSFAMTLRGMHRLIHQDI